MGAITSRGPVSHSGTRLNTGHLAALREMLLSTSAEMEGIVTYRNESHCYDVAWTAAQIRYFAPTSSG